MKRQEAEIIIGGNLKKIFGFALKRCRTLQDAEDLSQEIAARSFAALLKRDDISDPDSFIRAVAHNALSNYYRDSANFMVGVPLDEVAELVEDPDAEINIEGDTGILKKLRREIAYLSKTQRQIVIAYYFENRRQADIAKALGIPLGTVKWHLFEAKKELKRGIGKMRNTSELGFNPIRFSAYGINGSTGTKNTEDMFRSVLTQNICYCVRNTARSVNEIADALGVSPVYIESEAALLEENGYLRERNGKYETTFIISEPSTELLKIQNDMYRHAAGIFANELFDELTKSGILDAPDIVCRQTDEPISLETSPSADRNFLLWTLIPYIAACSGENERKSASISFDEVATIRPDGGKNIFKADVISTDTVYPDNFVYMNNWCGPMWNSSGRNILWQINSEWTDHAITVGSRYAEDSMRVLSLYEREEDGPLSKDEYAWLAERGFIKTNGDYDGNFKSSWQVVLLTTKEINERLVAFGDQIKARHRDEFDLMKKQYSDAVLAGVPERLRKIAEYELQYVFNCDGWFLLHCITALLENGKLKPPTEGQKKSLMTLIISEK